MRDKRRWGSRLRNFAKGVYIDDPSFSLGSRDPEDGVARDLLWAQMIRRQRPMHDGTLQGIRERVGATRALWKFGDDITPIGNDPGIVAAMDREDLLREVDRLRSEAGAS